MTIELEDGRTIEDVSSYSLDQLDECDFRELLTYVLRDFLDIRTIHITRSHGRIQNISFTKGD